MGNIYDNNSISRQAVLDVIFESRKNFNNEFDQGFFADKIRELPPVTPQPFINKPCVSEGVCREDKIKVLDKIRVELIRSIRNGTLTIEGGNEELFRIIDKYKEESEDKK